MKIAFGLLMGTYLFSTCSFAQRPRWEPQDSGVAASFRGLAVINPKVAWASGTSGTVLRTVDGGKRWTNVSIPDASTLDLRDIEAFSPLEAYAMSAGPGAASRIYKTVDGGGTWLKVLDNPDQQGFFDAMAFSSLKHGFVMGDPVRGSLTVLRTRDGGQTWDRIETPPALDGEGGFAASGTCLILRGNNEVLMGTGGKGAARIFRSVDGGKTWRIYATPLRNDAPAAGVFGLVADRRRVIAVGGAYDKPEEDRGAAAISRDSGKTWQELESIGGYRSGVAMRKGGKQLLAVGSHGASYSIDGGQTWQAQPHVGYHAVQFPRTGPGWAVGAKGSIARVSWEK